MTRGHYSGPRGINQVRNWCEWPIKVLGTRRFTPSINWWPIVMSHAIRGGVDGCPTPVEGNALHTFNWTPSIRRVLKPCPQQLRINRSMCLTDWLAGDCGRTLIVHHHAILVKRNHSMATVIYSNGSWSTAESVANGYVTATSTSTQYTRFHCQGGRPGKSVHRAGDPAKWEPDLVTSQLVTRQFFMPGTVYDSSR